MSDLTIIIPARNEQFIGVTVQNLLENITGNTEIIVVLDGYTVPIPEIPHDPKVTIIGHTTSIGQRAACNEAARLSTSKYLAKVDAHCAFKKGFDSVLLNDMQDNWTQVPTMRNLWGFDWKCEEGHTRYQGPSGPCTVCGKPTIMDIKWIAKESPQSNSYCFDPAPHFQYFKEYSKRPEGRGELTETMSLQGSFFMLTKEKWFELNICDESFGSWGSQGIEVAVKTWLSGGRVIVNHKTYYAHMFRTQGGDFGFPYPIAGSQVSTAKKTARNLFFNNKWDKAIYPLSWLVEKFWPVYMWTDKDLQDLKESEKVNWKPKPQKELTKGILYYTDNRIDKGLMKKCQDQLKKSGLPITSVSLQPIDFGKNIVVNAERSAHTMFKQILTGLEAMTEDIVYFCEHDVLYDTSHFDFTPSRDDTFYYNFNNWFLRLTDGHCLHYANTPLSSLCAYRTSLVTHFKERLTMIEDIGFSRNMGFEPFQHGRIKWKTWYKFEKWSSPIPNIDIRHRQNQLRSRWTKEEFRRVPKVWTEATEIPGWGKGKDLIKMLGQG